MASTTSSSNAQNGNINNSPSTKNTETHPERFWVDYVMEAESMANARKLAKDLCLEQTVELPGQIDAVKQVEAYTVGMIEHVTAIPHRPHLYKVTIAFPNQTAGNELTQFLNVVFGNTSLKKGVSVAHVTLSPELIDNNTMFPGPQFGIQGLRDKLGVPQAPLLCTALKPMGKSVQDFANMAYALAKGGIDIIKDDHGLANQVWAPFQQRVKLCAEAVQRANQETGKNALYAPCLNAPCSQLLDRAHYAKQVGAGAVMVLPGISGWDVVRELAADKNFQLPILIHPALLGGWLDSDDGDDDDDNHDVKDNTGSGRTSHIHHPHGFSHEFLFGILPRLCGGDAVIFPNAGGRFQFSSQECQAVSEGCRRPMGHFAPILPSPAGGMKLHRVQEMRRTFGDDTLFLIGGALLEQDPDLQTGAEVFVHCAGRDQPYRAPDDDNDIEIDDYKQKSTIITPPTSPKAMEELPSIAHVEQVAMAVRRRVLEYTLYNNGGYLSQACSSAETLATLYLRALNLGPSIVAPIPGPFRGSPGPNIKTITGEGHNGDYTNPTLDRLIFSPVHYALVLYSVLVEVGRLDIEAFHSYNKDGSTVELIGAEHSPGHAVTAGSLAQAFSQAAGIAYARGKLKKHTGRVIVYMSDGEFQEGQTWEAVQGAVFHKISNLTAVVDVNGQQCDGKMSDVTEIGNIASKLEAFGAVVKEVDGHNVVDIEAAIKFRHDTKPTIVLCYTDPCKGFPLLRERAPKLHYVRFKDREEKKAWKDVLNQMDRVMQDNQGVRKITFEEARKASDDEDDDKEGGSQRKRKLNPPEMPVPAKKKAETSAANGKDWATLDVELVPTNGSSEMVTRPHRTNLLKWAKSHPKAIILTADLTSSCEADLLRDELPNQYMSLGMAEQNMMSFAGGLAREGFHPYIHTFAVFVTRRPYDQVAMSIAVPNLPVRLLGFLPGLTTPGGVTHQAIDDIALMRAIPNMRILEVGDATEVESVLDVAESINGPVYIRMWRGQVPRLFPKTSPMKFGVARMLSDGSDMALVSAGLCTEEALKVRPLFESSGVSIRHLHLSTIVPFPVRAIVEAAKIAKYGIIVMENHSIIGGIGSATAEVLAEHGIGKKLVRLGVPGVYAHGASCAYLMKEYGFDSAALTRAVEKLVGKTLQVTAMGGAAREALSAEERPEDL